jgi:tetratricopeptide (TPR) repeat protein
MRYSFLIAAFIAVLLAAAFRFKEIKNSSYRFNINDYKKKNIVSCSPDWNQLQNWLEETDIPPLPGAGIYKWKISTINDSAQFYFNQGINCYYGFHIIEAMASFKKAARFDANCAMLYWAQALSYGPNINDFGYRASPESLAATSKAKELSATASAFEKDLIDAMQVRYTADSADATRAVLNQAYTDKMKAVYLKHRSIADAQVLYADAMMLQHPWNLWNTDGTPKEWTPQIQEVLENALVKFPRHPGANHYYIHVMEPSPFAAKALPSAKRLGVTNPGLSHLVHMPSHIFLRAGWYQQGVDVNTKAVRSYQKSIPLYAPVTGADFLYIIHNLHMKANNAMLLGNYEVSIKAVEETQQSIIKDYLSIPAPMGSYVQYINMTSVFVYVRFGKWNELLKIPQPAAEQVYANVLYHFGKGMALASTKKITDANAELNVLRQLMKDSSLSIPFTPFSPAIDGAVVAENLLAGTIALKEKNMNVAIIAFEKAVTIESNMTYNEPRDWLLNPKHYLGNALLLADNYSKAEKVFAEDLQYNNENGWALYGLYLAQLQLQKRQAAAETLSRYTKAFGKAYIKLAGPVF